jgi:hypothetical protein
MANNAISKIIEALPSPSSEIPQEVIDIIAEDINLDMSDMDVPMSKSEFFSHPMISDSEPPKVMVDFWEFNDIAGKQYLKFSISSILIICSLCKRTSDIMLYYLYIISSAKQYDIHNVDTKFLMNSIFALGVFSESDSDMLVEHKDILLNEREWLLYLTDKDNEYEGEIIMVRFDGHDDVPFPKEMVKEWGVSDDSKDEERVYFWNDGKFLSISMEDYVNLK